MGPLQAKRAFNGNASKYKHAQYRIPLAAHKAHRVSSSTMHANALATFRGIALTIGIDYAQCTCKL